ncbi:MAG: alpha/beta fold hydrolase, partial [Alphaproteobacteria bacterium]|nr:alpha/beta fold hydrolase [Alphaproteobacteria bacterium]
MFWDKWFEPKPYQSGYLPEKAGYQVYFETFGNPKGKPVLLFHGGPGGSFHRYRAKYANLKKYYVIMFDQRGCGRSLPLGEIKHNITKNLLDDTTRLLSFLKIKKKVILWGASWGSTLALLWAEQNPQKVERMLLSQIFLANKASRDWEFGGTRYIYPEFVEKMERDSCGKILNYYNKLIHSDNKKNQLQAANTYGWFERVCGSLNPSFNHLEELSDKELASHRIYMHYADNKFFLSDNQILDDIDRIKNIKTLIIHNRLDLICPYKGAYEVHHK